MMLQRRRRDRGQAVIETAVVAGFLVILVLGVIGFGAILSANIKCETAAREGARVAATGGTNDDIRNAVLYNLTKSGQYSDVPGAAALGITPVDQAARLFNTVVKVEVWWRYPVPVPIFNLFVKNRELYAWNEQVVTVGDNSNLSNTGGQAGQPGGNNGVGLGLGGGNGTTNEGAGTGTTSNSGLGGTTDPTNPGSGNGATTTTTGSATNTTGITNNNTMRYKSNKGKKKWWSWPF